MLSNSFLCGDRLDGKHALVILNTSGYDYSMFLAIWSSFELIICADGGANRLYDWFGSSCDSDGCSRSDYIPSKIIGDLDSIREDVRDYYSTNGCEIIQDRNQDNNDLDKSIKYARDFYMPNEKISIVILGSSGGRVDQSAAVFHSIYKWSPLFHRIIYFGESSNAFLLSPSCLHTIKLLDPLTMTLPSGRIKHYIEGPICGLLPIGHRVDQITTTGLKWNLNGDALEMGQFISSSNQICDNNEEKRITVITSQAILFCWSYELQ